MGLFRIVFVSDAVGAAGEGLLPLIDIIGVSDRNNRRDQITSAMLRHDGRFVQIMEGARVDLDRTLGRIRADRRHSHIRILSDRAVSERLFPDCPMARINVTPRLDLLVRTGLSLEKAGHQIEQLMAEAHHTASPVT